MIAEYLKVKHTEAEIPQSCGELYPQQISYTPDHRLHTKSASALALKVAAWIRTGQGLTNEPDEKTLFVALHTCAYRATRVNGRSRTSKAKQFLWAAKWQIIRVYIIEKNLGLAYSMVQRFNSQHADEDDLLSDALYTLIRVMERYNPWKGFRFSTYACTAIIRDLRRCSERESRYQQRFPVPLDKEIDKMEPLPDENRELYTERLKRVLNNNLAELTDQESKILTWRFPADRKTKLGLQQVGDILGLSKERVRQIQNFALLKLREALERDPVLQLTEAR